jgi:hypothetical protein
MLIVNNLQDITREYSQQYTQKSPVLCLAGMSGVSFAFTPLCGTGQRAWSPPPPNGLRAERAVAPSSLLECQMELGYTPIWQR